tara:strand:- start:2834 stop:3142 length:309 start_codon:yes stop_codon:yes gene_type:complete
MMEQLTQEHLSILLTTKGIPDHLQQFIHRWHDSADRPHKVTQTLIFIADLDSSQRKHYYVDMNDDLHYIDPKAYKRWQRFDNRGWVCTYDSGFVLKKDREFK